MKYLRSLLGTLAIILSLVTNVSAQDVVTYFHPDASGSPTVATDEYGNVLWREDYAPYGERLRQELSPRTNRVWFTGHHQDDDSGLIYSGARHYDPMIGRFLSVDPAPVDTQNSFTVNRYAYANNNPFLYVDPNGEDTLIALKYYNLGSFANQSYGHAYVYLQDKETDERVISRGGPNEKGFNEILAAAQDGDIKSADGKGYVTLKISMTPEKESLDYDAKGVVTISKMTVKDDIKAVKEKMQAFNNNVMSVKIPYHVRSQNSNSYAFTGYEELTGNRPAAQKDLPGSATNLKELTKKRSSH